MNTGPGDAAVTRRVDALPGQGDPADLLVEVDVRERTADLVAEVVDTADPGSAEGYTRVLHDGPGSGAARGRAHAARSCTPTPRPAP